jgi:hypothetical protein
MRMNQWIAVPAVVVLMAAAAPAQEEKKDDRLGGFLIPPDRVFEEIAKGLSKHYGLDEEQSQLARQMVADYGRRFVSRNADELRALQMEGMKLALLGGKPDSDTLRDLSRRVKALMYDGKEPLDQFSEEFHGILNEDQKLRHDIERKQVALLMQVVDLELDKMIATGQLPGPDQNNPSKPGSDADKMRPARRFTGAGFVERQWESYVKAFAAHYRLDGEQNRRAEEMLALAKKDAAEYRKANEERIKEFGEKFKALRDAYAAREATAEQRAKALADRKALDAEADQFEAPLRDMFEKLKEALDVLPTAEQKIKYGAFPLRNLGAKKAG